VLTPATRTGNVQPHTLYNPGTKPSLSAQSLAGLAKPIIDYATQLPPHAHLTDVIDTSENLLSEYLLKCQQAGYHHETCLIAQFILAAFIDANLLSHDITDESQTLVQKLPQGLKLASQFSNILDTCYKMPGAFVDLLELLYLCQSLNPDLNLADTQKNTLYTIIKQARGEQDLRLSPPKPKLHARPLHEKTRLFMLGGVVVMIVLIGGVLASFDIVLQDTQTVVEKNLSAE